MKLKKILFGVAMFLTIGNITVNAQNEVTITGDSEGYTRIEWKSDEIADANAEVGGFINATCNTDLSFKLDYSIGNGDYKAFTYNEDYPDGVFRCTAGQELELTKRGAIVNKTEFSNAETTFNLRITPAGNENLEPIYFTQNVAAFEYENVYFGENDKFAAISITLPLDAKVHGDKINDPVIMNKLKSYEVYKIYIEADKDINYYIENFYKKYDKYLYAYYNTYLMPKDIDGTNYRVHVYSKDLTELALYDVPKKFYALDSDTDIYQYLLNDNNDYFKMYDNGYIAFKSEESEANYTPLTVTTRETIEVPNTSAKVKLIVILSGIILAIIGTSILSKNLSKQINE